MLVIDAVFDTLSPGNTGQALFAATGTGAGVASAATGVLLDFATANTLKVRNPANNADAALTASNGTFSGTLTYGGVTLSSSVTGTGSLVLSASPSLTGTVTFASLSATGTGVFISGAVASAGVVQAIGIGSVAAFGVYFGAGTPSITSASQGSLYLNTTGSSTATRMFVFSSASTWIAVTTAS